MHGSLFHTAVLVLVLVVELKGGCLLNFALRRKPSSHKSFEVSPYGKTRLLLYSRKTEAISPISIVERMRHSFENDGPRDATW